MTFLKKFVFVTLLLLPLAVLAWELVHGELGAQPFEKMNHELGEVTYRLLALNLIWGSLLALNWFPQRLRRYTILRRHLGVVTFVYALLHVGFYVVKEGDPALALRQMFEKLYLIVGLLTLSILFLLALTSNGASVRRLKKNWKRLHRLAYVAIALGTFHFYLIEKKDWRVTLPLLIPVLLLYLARAGAGIMRRAPSRSVTRPSS